MRTNVPKEAKTMSTVTTKDGVQIFYKDWGHGQPIVFHHGWPLSDGWFDRSRHGEPMAVTEGTFRWTR
jgi:pimeloyl-ACP methyl ester carboxylesterase